MEMTCNFCGASVSGTVTEALAWDRLHVSECPGHFSPQPSVRVKESDENE